MDGVWCSVYGGIVDSGCLVIDCMLVMSVDGMCYDGVKCGGIVWIMDVGCVYIGWVWCILCDGLWVDYGEGLRNETYNTWSNFGVALCVIFGWLCISMLVMDV